MLSGRKDRAQQFDALIRPHVMPMYHTAYRLLRNAEDAEDLVQDVMTKLYPRLDDMAQVEALRPWLLRVVYHSYVDFLRRLDRSPKTLADENSLHAVADETSRPDTWSENEQLSSLLGDAVARLPEEQRALVDLHLVQGYTLQELASAFETPLGTLKAQVHRIKGKLRKELADATFSSV